MDEIFISYDDLLQPGPEPAAGPYPHKTEILLTSILLHAYTELQIKTIRVLWIPQVG